MLKNIEIKGLFGRFNYKLNFEDKNIVILTGPNGFGKSTILQIVDAIANNRFFYLLKVEFEELYFEFIDNENLNKIVSIIREEKRLLINKTDIKLDKSFNEVNKMMTDFPWISQIDSNTFEDRRFEKYYTFDELFLRYLYSKGNDIYINSQNRINEIKKEIKKIEKILKETKALFGEIVLISEQRLIRKQNINKRRNEEEVGDVIVNLPEELKKEISKVSEKYSNIANKLDSTYPNRLFRAEKGLNSEAEFNDLLNKSKEKFQKLEEYDLVNMSNIEDSKYKSEYATALKIYFDDFSKKYEVFESLIKKFDLFTNIINSRFNFKKVKISKTHGLEIIDKSDSNKTIDLQQLSSGEKQEIILFYNLIFKTKDNLLLLIDEPEISLHIVWQKKFLEDLLKITENSKIKVILATHSPQIISNHWDLQIDLGEQYQSDELNSK